MPRRSRGPESMLFALACALALVSPSPAAAQATCPTTEYSLSTAETFTHSAATLDASNLANRLVYDLGAGTLHLEYCCSLAPTFMRVRDAFDVTGVPPGTPVSLTLEVPVSGEIYDAGGCGGSGCGGTFRASITHGSDYAEYIFASPALFHGARASFGGVVRLPLTIVAGQPETLTIEFWARRAPGGSHGAIGDGILRFTGLLPGESVISCLGYAGAATPALRASWGGLKLLYR